jgi:hypothetical protein
VPHAGARLGIEAGRRLVEEQHALLEFVRESSELNEREAARLEAELREER